MRQCKLAKVFRDEWLRFGAAVAEIRREIAGIELGVEAIEMETFENVEFSETTGEMKRVKKPKKNVRIDEHDVVFYFKKASHEKNRALIQVIADDFEAYWESVRIRNLNEGQENHTPRRRTPQVFYVRSEPIAIPTPPASAPS